MKRYDYYRPSAASLGKKKRVVRRQKGSSFFFRFVMLLLLAGVLLGVGWTLTRSYQWFVQTRPATWKPKQIEVTGITGDFYKKIVEVASPHQNQPFSVKDAVALREEILTKYPMLKKVSVKRGLFKGTLTIAVERRTPVAKFVLPDGSLKYIDAQSVIYTDPAPDTLAAIPSIELEGEIPERLNPELVELVQSTLKLKKALEFSALQMNLAHNTIKLFTPDGCEIDFGQAADLKKKAVRAAQIMAFAREKYPRPFVLNFAFFEVGKVFLTPRKA